METDQIIEKVCSEWEQDRYAMYLRKSRADLEMEALGEGETLARHKHMLEHLAAKHDINPNQIDVYKELVSGESIEDRPEVQRLLTNIHQKKYKGVLVVEVERLARGNTKDQGEVAEAFQASNTKIITPAKVYDPQNEFDQEYFEFGLFMSRREYKTITRRMSAGKHQSVQEGNYISSAKIYGYEAVRFSKKDRILIEVPEEAKIVQMIFDWFVNEGKATGWIANELTRMGVPTTKGKPEWNRGTIRDMLSNVHYIGLVRWNQAKTVKEYDEKSGKMVKRRRKAKTEYYKGKHKPIIDKKLFDLAQTRFPTPNPLKSEFKLVNPLAGLVTCCDCGKHIGIWGHKQKADTRFMHPRSQLCKKKSLPLNDVLESFVEALKACIEDFELKMENDHDQAELLRHKEKIAVMEKELAKQEAKKRRLFDSWEADDGTYTKEEFIERKQLYTKTIDNIKQQISEAKASMPEPVDYTERIASIHKMIETFQDPSLDADEKNYFLKLFIDHVEYDSIDYGYRKGGKAILDIYFK